MGFTKKFLGLKLNTTSFVNPQAGVTPLASLTGAATAYTSAVPCRGARQVVFTIKGAGSGSLQSQTSFGGSHPNMVDCVTGSTADFSVQGDGLVVINGSNGGVIAVRPTLLQVFAHGYVSVGLTNDATAKTNVTVDAEVFYEFDADVCAVQYGQGGETIL